MELNLDSHLFLLVCVVAFVALVFIFFVYFKSRNNDSTEKVEIETAFCDEKHVL